jgi:hypothetical protein
MSSAEEDEEDEDNGNGGERSGEGSLTITTKKQTAILKKKKGTAKGDGIDGRVRFGVVWEAVRLAAAKGIIKVF